MEMPNEPLPGLLKALFLIGLLASHVRIFRLIMVTVLGRNPDVYSHDKFRPIVRLKNSNDPIYR